MVIINVVDDVDDVGDVSRFVVVGNVRVEQEMLLLLVLECYNLARGAIVRSCNRSIETRMNQCDVPMVNYIAICIVGVWGAQRVIMLIKVSNLVFFCCVVSHFTLLEKKDVGGRGGF